MLSYIKKSLEGAISIAATVNYMTAEQLAELESFVDNIRDTQYFLLDIQDFDSTLSESTLNWNYATKEITNSSGGISSIVSNKIVGDYSTNKIYLDFLNYVSSATSNTISISVNDVDYQAIAEVDANYEIASSTGFRVKVEFNDGAFKVLNMGFKV